MGRRFRQEDFELSEVDSLDEEGFVKQPELWNPSLARLMAEQQFKLILDESHLRVINYVREYYLKWGAIPMNKTIVTKADLTNNDLDQMFKRGNSSARGVICKLGGLPKLLCVAMGC